MAEAMVGVLENVENPSSDTVLSYFKNEDTLLDRLNTANPRKVNENVVEKHFDLIKRITKSFIDSATENFKDCAPFSPFIGWAT